jgi:hypothetical protein
MKDGAAGADWGAGEAWVCRDQRRIERSRWEWKDMVRMRGGMRKGKGKGKDSEVR